MGRFFFGLCHTFGGDRKVWPRDCSIAGMETKPKITRFEDLGKEVLTFDVNNVMR